MDFAALAVAGDQVVEFRAHFFEEVLLVARGDCDCGGFGAFVGVGVLDLGFVGADC